MAPVLRICRGAGRHAAGVRAGPARVRALFPQQIAARLGDRFRLLAGS